MALLHQIKSSWDVSRILWSWKIWSSIIWRSWVLDISLILSWFPQYLKCPKAKQSPQSFTVHWALTKPVVVIWWYSVSSLKHWLRYTYNLTSTLNSCSYDITVSCPCPAQGSVVVAWHRRSWSCLSPKPPRAEMFERGNMSCFAKNTWGSWGLIFLHIEDVVKPQSIPKSWSAKRICFLSAFSLNTFEVQTLPFTSWGKEWSRSLDTTTKRAWTNTCFVIAFSEATICKFLGVLLAKLHRIASFHHVMEVRNMHRLRNCKLLLLITFDPLNFLTPTRFILFEHENQLHTQNKWRQSSATKHLCASWS